MAKMRTRMTRRESHRRIPSRSSRIRRLMEVKEALSIVTVGIQNRTKMKITIKILLSKISLFLLLVCWIFDMEIKGLQPRLKPNFESYLKINSIHFGIWIYWYYKFWVLKIKNNFLQFLIFLSPKTNKIKIYINRRKLEILDVNVFCVSNVYSAAKNTFLTWINDK